MSRQFNRRRLMVRAIPLVLLCLPPIGCEPTREAAAAPVPDVQAAAPLPPLPTSVSPAEDPGPRKPVKTRSELADEAQALRAELESLDAAVQTGLTRLAESLKDLDADRRQWTAMDRSIAAARAVNNAVGGRNKAVIRLYDQEVANALTRFERRLKDAPPVYRRMAEERRQYLAEASLELERRSYLAMAELCESAAVLCERRHEELFGTAAPGSGMMPRARRMNAAVLSETIANMRKLSLVHDRWEETFAAYPTSLDDGRLAALFEHLAAYAEDLEAFTRGVESLKEAMKKKVGKSDAAAPPAKRERPAEPAPRATQPAPELPQPPAPAPAVAASSPPYTSPPHTSQPVSHGTTYVVTPYRTADGRVAYHYVPSR